MSDKRRRHNSLSDSDSDDYLQWKISKLQRRLESRKRKRQRSPSSSVYEHRDRQRGRSSSRHLRRRRRRTMSLDPSPMSVERRRLSDDSADDNVPLSVLAQGPIAAATAVADMGEDEIEEIPDKNSPLAPSHLNEDVLALLGDEEPVQESVGPKIHSDLASRWSGLLGRGVKEEALSKLIKKYPPLKNCLLLKSPRLNAEVKSAINEQVMRRDDNLVSLQTQVGSALSALGLLLSELLSEKGGEDKHMYIELASDASRLLLDIHYKYSGIRRDLVALNLRKDLKDTLNNVSADGWLFGSDLGDRIKASKDIKKTALDLKPSSSTKKPVFSTVKKTSLNLRRPPRQAFEGTSRGGRQSKGLASGQQRQGHQSQRDSYTRGHQSRSNARPRDNHRRY